MSVALRWAVALGLLAAACGEEVRPEDRVPTMEVSASDAFVRRVTAEGYLRAAEATPLNAPQEAKRPMKIAWIAEDGSAVNQGQVVVRFDAAEMEQILKDSEDDVRSAAAQIDKEQVTGTVSRRKRDRTAALAAKEVETAREFESDDERILSRNEIAESRIDVDLAQAKSKHATKVKAVERSVTQSKLDIHAIARRKSSGEVKRAQDGLAQLEIKAPHAGILVLSRDWRGNTVRVGDSIWRGQKVAELPLVTEMEAELFVFEADAGGLTEGLPAEVVIESRPGTTYPATIKRVDTLAKPRKQDVPVQYFGVTLQFEATDREAMKVGGRVRAAITLDAGAAIVVPRQAVFEDDGESFVYRRSGAQFERVEVKLGAASAGRVVVEEGLAEGDTIALRDPTQAAGELLDRGGAKAEPAGAPGAMR